MLHDFGQLAMLVTETTRFEQVTQQTARGDMKFLYRERQTFGIDHTEAGATLLRHWGLPAPLIDAARHHHDDNAEAFAARPLVAIVALADTLAQRMGMGMDFTTGTSTRTDAALEALGLHPDDALRIAQALPARVADAQDMLKQTDRIGHWATDDRGPLAHWVTATGEEPDEMARLLLQTRGYIVHACRLDTLTDSPPTGLLLFADDANAGPGLKGIELIPGLRMREDSNNAGRYRIPQHFSTFDLAWAEEQLS